jgi:hypothetical protein
MQELTSIGRRALMRDSLRTLALGGLTALAVVLWRKRRRADCTNRGLCNRCASLEGCHLPLAVQYRSQR